MIAVDVIVYATLAQYLPNIKSGEPFKLEVEMGTSILNLHEKLRIPPEKTKLIYVNGVFQSMDYLLQEGDRVALFPPIAGG